MLLCTSNPEKSVSRTGREAVGSSALDPRESTRLLRLPPRRDPHPNPATTALGAHPPFAQPAMRRSYHRRSADERVADLDKRISELKAKQSARERKDDPVLREMQKLLKRLKRFIQHAHDHKRPDVANSVMGFKSMLERILATELGASATELAESDDEDDE
jgi:hypothetical protein